MVTGRPVGGDAASGTLTVWVCPAGNDAMRFSTTIGLPEPVIDTRTVTSFSSFWPWFITWTSKLRFGLVLIWLAPPCDSVVPLGWTVTVPSPLPWLPGATGPRGPPPRLVERAAPTRGGPRQPGAASKRLLGSGD